MSKTQDIKRQIQAAIDAVKDFDEPYKTKAFEVILSKSLETIPTGPTSKRIEHHIEKKGKSLPVKEKIAKFAEAANLSVDQLANVFEFGDDGLNFIAPLTGSIKQKQVDFTQCVLICLERVYEKKSIEATELVSMLDDFGLSTKNLSRSLQSHPDIFRKIGKKRETRYRLTDVGKTSALKLVHELATVGTQPQQ